MLSVGCEMQKCRFCNRLILEDSESCPFCGGRVREERVERLGTVRTPATTSDITATPADMKDWQRDELVFIFFCLACLCLGMVSIFLDVAGWATILCFILAALFLAMIVYSHVKVTDLKRRLRAQ